LRQDTLEYGNRLFRIAATHLRHGGCVIGLGLEQTTQSQQNSKALSHPDRDYTNRSVPAGSEPFGPQAASVDRQPDNDLVVRLPAPDGEVLAGKINRDLLGNLILDALE